MNASIPVTIVTGFLGSGKTTLLSSLIRHRQTRRLAILINEFGEVSIDGALIRETARDAERPEQVRIHDFSHGLIAYGDDERFVPTMQAIAARRAGVDHVLIETSGLALPTAAMELLQGPELAADFVLDATLAVVDTPLMLDDRFEPAGGSGGSPGGLTDSVATMFRRQLEAADVVVLNKIDALDEHALLDAEARVRRCAPNVRFLELAYEAQLDIRLALGLRLHQAARAADVHHHGSAGGMPHADAAVLHSHASVNGHSHSGLGSHHHGLATHKHFHEQDPGWMSFMLSSPDPQQAPALKAALAQLAREEPILRCKGFVREGEPAQALLVQAVRARVTTVAEQHKHPPAASELVFIGYHPSRARTAALLSELTATHWS